MLSNTAKSSKVLAVRVTGAIFSFLYNLLLARMLGAEGAGTYFLAGTIVTIATIVGRVGLDNVVLRYAAIAIDQQNWYELRTIYWRILKTACLACLFITLAIYFGSDWIVLYLFNQQGLQIPLALMSLSIIPLSLLNLHAELLKAAKKTVAATIVQAFSVPVLGSILLLLVVPSYGVAGAAIVSTATSLTIMLLAIFLCTYYIPELHNKNLKTDCTTTLDIKLFKSGWSLMLIALLNLVIDFTDTIMLGMLTGATAVGIYAVLLNITRVNSLILTSINSIVAPQFSILWSAGSITELEKLAQSVTRQMALVAFVIFLIIAAIPVQILSLFGSDFQIGETALLILAFGQFIALATGPVAFLLMMSGHEKFHRNNVLLCALLNILLNYLLIPDYGIVGAALATCVALTVKNILAVVFVRSKLKIKVLF